jgi:hypothetical protein
MTTIVAQATTATPPDVGTYVQEVFQSLMGIDVMLALKLVGVWIFLIWVVFALWVAFDAASRYKRWPVAIIWFIFVLPFNVFGFVGYLFMRPVVTLEEKQWTKLESKYLMHELSSVNDCPTCSTLVPVTQNYCAACGTQMNVNCPKCDSLQSIYNGFCSHCGQKLTPEKKEEVVEEKEVAVRGPRVLDRIGAIILQAKDNVTGAMKNTTSKISDKLPKKKAKAASTESKS